MGREYRLPSAAVNRGGVAGAAAGHPAQPAGRASGERRAGSDPPGPVARRMGAGQPGALV